MLNRFSVNINEGAFEQLNTQVVFDEEGYKELLGEAGIADSSHQPLQIQIRPGDRWVYNVNGWEGDTGRFFSPYRKFGPPSASAYYDPRMRTLEVTAAEDPVDTNHALLCATSEYSRDVQRGGKLPWGDFARASFALCSLSGGVVGVGSELTAMLNHGYNLQSTGAGAIGEAFLMLGAFTLRSLQAPGMEKFTNTAIISYEPIDSST